MEGMRFRLWRFCVREGLIRDRLACEGRVSDGGRVVDGRGVIDG